MDGLLKGPLRSGVFGRILARMSGMLDLSRGQDEAFAVEVLINVANFHSICIMRLSYCADCDTL